MPDLGYDVIVIGAGPVGENVADRIGQGGLTVAIVEAELVGGERSYWACMPTKAPLRDAAALRAVLAGAAGAVTGHLAAAVLSRRDRFASHWQDDGQVAWLNAAAGITLARGHGRIAGARTVSVTAADGTVSTLTARHAVVIATGSSAALPPIPGLAQARPWTSRQAASSPSIPTRWTDVMADASGGLHRSAASGTELAARAAELPDTQLTESARRVSSATSPRSTCEWASTRPSWTGRGSLWGSRSRLSS
jgi:dihydrolipoamide dehydrogenase